MSRRRARSRSSRTVSGAILSILSVSLMGGTLAASAAAPAQAQLWLEGAWPIVDADAPTAQVSRFADLNADGNLDWIALTQGGAQLRVLAGDGTGRFVFASSAPLDRIVFEIDIADLDGDGHLDIVVPENFTLPVFFGDSTLELGTPLDVWAGLEASSIAVGDFDEDGNVDLVAASDFAGGKAVIVRGLGGRAFGPPVDFTEGDVRDLEVADLDGDGHLDLIVVKNIEQEVFLAFGRGDGTFDTSTLAPEFRPSAVLARDFASDAVPDLLVFFGLDRFRLYEGDGSRGFAALGDDVSLPNQAFSPAVVDWNGDGNLDLVYVDDSWLGFVLGDGAGGFALERRSLGAVEVFGSTVADVDADGVPDLAAETLEIEIPGRLLLRGDGSGGVVESETLPIGEDRVLIAAGDFDGDGADDLAVVDRELGGLRQRISALRNRGDGTFEEPVLVLSGTDFPSLRVADMDADGFDDLVVPERQIGLVRILHGDPSFGWARRTDFGQGSRPSFSLPVDLDGDGRLDLATLFDDGELLGTALADGAGGFVRIATPFLVGPDAENLAAADFDGDGIADLAAASDDELVLLLGDGAGRFETRRLVAGLRGGSVAAGDWNADGRADLAVIRVTGRRIVALLGDGAGDFEFGPSFPARRLTADLETGDVDADGVDDLAFFDDSVFQVVLGGTDDDAIELAAFHDETLVGDLALADFDVDGILDVIILDEDDEVLRLHRNDTFDALRCRLGNVAYPSRTPVVLVGGSPGEGPERRVALAPDAPTDIRVEGPPSNPDGPARFALYAWVGDGTDSDVRRLPFEAGLICRPHFLTDADPARLAKVWNNLGRPSRLGEPDLPSDPAPSTVASFPSGIGRELTFFLQGILVDDEAPSGRAAITNGVLVEVAAP